MDPLILQTAQSAARRAADILMQYRGRAKIEYKSEQTQNLVTEADLAAEASVLATIKDAFPGHEILGEEGLSSGKLSSPELWVVDPLDGTTNYAQGIPQFCVSIAYVEDGVGQVGVVHDPNRNEVYHAVRGQGAFMNDEPIRVSERAELSQAVLATGFYYDRGEMMRRTLESIEALFEQNIRGIRRLGSAALDQCWVACGRMDGFFEYQLAPWDYAAASLIVQEAGGKCSDRERAELALTSESLLATNGLLFQSILDVVRWTSAA